MPKVTVSFAVDLEVEYDPFEGRTITQVTAALQDELDQLLFEASPEDHLRAGILLRFDPKL